MAIAADRAREGGHAASGPTARPGRGRAAWRGPAGDSKAADLTSDVPAALLAGGPPAPTLAGLSSLPSLPPS
ncbi:hypothetical protein OHA11_30685 [Streptomyces sp. NBC_00878]|nr:hypothetical protein [Streptomyces sp. NBC_00878]